MTNMDQTFIWRYNQEFNKRKVSGAIVKAIDDNAWLAKLQLQKQNVKVSALQNNKHG